ncbi:MAG: glycosyltransferase family 2 protein [Acidobacteria bacterium]|nr:glycosyltransferase family 2 protein [Acidobacteriota bacterium]
MLIPNFNGRLHLQACLLSLQEQTRQPHEILVFDNGSSDHSADFIRERFPSVQVIASSTNLGFAGAMNRAAEAAGGAWLALLNNDMRAAPDWIESAMAEAGRHGCIASRILNWSGNKIDFDGASLQYLGFAEQLATGESADRPASPGPILFPCGGAMFVRRDLFLEAGGFDEDYFAVYEDVDLGWRLWLLGHDVLLNPGSVAYHRGHATLDTRREEKKRYLMHRNAMFTIIKNYGQDAFQKVLPVAFFQALRRTVRFAGIDKTAFYFWEDAQIPEDPASLWMWKDAVNHLVALDDVIENWLALMQKRRQVQARRKRADSEIVPLFHEPFRRIFKDASYEESEAQWIRHLGIDDLFAGEVPFAFTDAFESERAREVRELRRELSVLKSQLQEAGSPARRGRGTMEKLARRLKRLGTR